MYAIEQLEGGELRKADETHLKRDISMLTFEGTATQGANAIVEKLVVGANVCLLNLVAWAGRGRTNDGG